MNTEKSTRVAGRALVTCIMALILGWNLVMTIFGKADLAWWYYPVLGICALSWQDALDEESKELKNERRA